ncbi:Tyrosine-protein kinase receptor Tie-1 [Holothuria leucospilota]|uniref:Tyrosine-protein kinase receptor Tie-1 n=1 Tax=Holothuria leucospilota TaxID=206669 RepID=A0A9Q1C7C5_HOLLE|nr:Tyrosine-protein kinase receptor Tie-1 [Holothuria leucospilota]
MFLTSQAEIQSRDEFLTKTVNTGDVGIEIRMKKLTSRTNAIQWRKDNSEPIPGRNNLIYQIENYVTTANEGIYECHYQHRRDIAPHGLQRLLVRGCRANNWGPPDCLGICENCYNGGVCDDETGKCICPAGFRGANCLEACVGKFGYDCEFNCENNEDRENLCLGSMFCLMDPYGCQCSVGYEGFNCSTRCTGNTFGANCLQQCHCNNGQCNVFTGFCEHGCQDGYEGESCQIPTGTCKIGYYGSQCIQKCHCKDNEACRKTTGSCPGECSRGYAVLPGMTNCEET